MGRKISTATLAFALVLFTNSFARAQRGADESIRYARAILADACELHSLLEVAGADGFTIRSASRLESSVEELLEALSCPSSIGQVGDMVDDCILWYGRTSVGVQRDCHLVEDRAVTSILSCAGRQLALLEQAVACLLGHGGHGVAFPPVTRPTWNAPPSAFAPHEDLAPQFGRSGAWVNDSITAPAEVRLRAYPLGSEEFRQPGYRQRGVGQTNLRQPTIYQSQFAPSQPSFSSQRGQIARSVLELVLSEMSK